MASGKVSGFTLIEIMVALSISTFLLSGVVSIALSSKQSYLVKENVGRMQESLRLSSEILTRTLSMAESLHQDSHTERIIVRYSGGDGVGDCLGNEVVSGVAVNYFYVKNKTLYCGATYPATPGSEQPLADGVAKMTVQYGVDENNHGQVDRYIDAPLDWNQVISARIALQLLNPSGSLLPVVTLTVAMRPRIFSRLN
jgi:type IV pilus assembly protein PilW